MEKFKLEKEKGENQNSLEEGVLKVPEKKKEIFEEIESMEDVDPDFGIPEGGREKNREDLHNSIKKFQNRKSDHQQKNAIRKFLGI